MASLSQAGIVSAGILKTAQPLFTFENPTLFVEQVDQGDQISL
jgi:hypothetical protein